MDYQYKNGNSDIHDLVSDLVKCINHFLNNLKKYNLQKDCFADIGDGVLSPSGLKRMLGPKGIDKNHLSIYSPKTYIDSFKMLVFAQMISLGKKV